MTNKTTEYKERCLDMATELSTMWKALDGLVRPETIAKIKQIKSLLGEVAEELEGN